jgi:hypothetical protein
LILYDIFYRWANDVGIKIWEADKSGDLLRKLIYNIRAEETPGRFLDKLSETLGEYKTNKNIGLNIGMHTDLYGQTWFADKFHYLKSAILSGLFNSLAQTQSQR